MAEHVAATARDLLDTLTLARVEVYKISAISAGGYDLSEIVLQAPDDDSANITVSQSLRVRGNGIDVRCSLQARSEQWFVEVDLAAVYDCVEGDTLTAPEDAVAADFGAKVGMMALWPYARQHVTDLTTRVTGGAPFVLPIVQASFFARAVRIEIDERPASD